MLQQTLGCNGCKWNEQIAFLEIFQNFQDISFYEHLWMAAFGRTLDHLGIVISNKLGVYSSVMIHWPFKIMKENDSSLLLQVFYLVFCDMRRS